MYTRYFRLKDPKCRPERIEWIEMSGKEFYDFVNSPEGQARHFIDMEDVVLETTEEQARQYKAEQDHHYYIQSQEDGWNTLSIYAIEDESGCSGEEAVRDETQDVEAEVILRMERRALWRALCKLDEDSRILIHALYFADERKTEREIAQERGVSQVAIHKQKKKILVEISLLPDKGGTAPLYWVWESVSMKKLRIVVISAYYSVYFALLSNHCLKLRVYSEFP